LQKKEGHTGALLETRLTKREKLKKKSKVHKDPLGGAAGQKKKSKQLVGGTQKDIENHCERWKRSLEKHEREVQKRKVMGSGRELGKGK